MTLFLSLLPIYLFGNLHCIGMCGPLVMMIGHHRFRLIYFLGRTLSFSLAGLLAGGVGAVIHIFLQMYHISALTSFLFGGVILSIGMMTLLGRQLPGTGMLSKLLAPLNRSLSLLMTKDQPWPVFLFGFFTIALPCGQTMIVFSACALYGDAALGMLNGFLFALFTSPSLFLAMNAHNLLQNIKHHYDTIIGACALIIGALAILRGSAEMGWIPHWIVNPNSPSEYHIVIY